MPCAIVERMAVLDEDFGTDLTLVEGKGEVRSCPVSLEHIGVKQRRDRHPAAYSYPMPSAWLSSTSRSRAFSRSRLDRSS